MKEEQEISIQEAMIFSHRIGQLSKALWKSVERDWQEWLKPFDLNINEHHILSIAYHLDGSSISDIAKFGVMHVSTAFNFSKKLESRSLLTFSKKENDKRNTYVQLTEKGEKLLQETWKHYSPNRDSVLKASMPIRDLYGKFPEFTEMMCVIKELYGEDFMEIFQKSFTKLESEFSKEFTSQDDEERLKSF
ncbi:HTH-type transcriptional regulator Hpr [Guptibacillus sedimenti]|uniref:HTH-type transcriptional regulator Hpr n=1 Tax=Guptibacillus sedimenti TaxID=3025680 RepID=UPI00235FAFCB|nr:HTH-type transcriptional regulator Hpr [Pseudalkalibacillus sedimenti]